ITAERTNEIIRRIEDRIRVEIGPSEVMIVPLASGRSRESVAKEVTESVEGVREAHTFEFYGERGERLHLHVVLGDDINLKRANEIAKEVESRLKRALGVKEVIVHVDHSGEGVPLKEIRERIEELRDVRWASVETVRSGSCVRVEIRVGADPEMRAREINRLQHDVMAIAAELAPKAKVSVRVVPAC
ncbi:MAG: cation transporter dimerization domain-containing protein, partial [Candidatus Korarchaeota archaeon]|nr:cation transporter dimerization domain-containing protein [Candidatus Korarchaeota archaeon]